MHSKTLTSQGTEVGGGGMQGSEWSEFGGAFLQKNLLFVVPQQRLPFLIKSQLEQLKLCSEYIINRMRLNQETLRSGEKRWQSQIQKEETQIPKTENTTFGKSL